MNELIRQRIELAHKLARGDANIFISVPTEILRVLNDLGTQALFHDRVLPSFSESLYSTKFLLGILRDLKDLLVGIPFIIGGSLSYGAYFSVSHSSDIDILVIA